MRFVALLSGLTIMVCHVAVAHCSIVINEFLPDPEGSDSGKEFVELFNSGNDSININGLQLQFANGAEEAHWISRWTCEQNVLLRPGQLYLICDRNWQGEVESDVEVYLGLQNGPDAIRLVQGTVTTDLVGYGPLTDVDLMEAEAVRVVTGKSLARRPDGHDSNNNAHDFVAAEPSPGLVNFIPFDLRTISIVAEPPSAIRQNEPIIFQTTLENFGTESFPTGRIILELGTQQRTGVLDGIAPGQQRSVLFCLAPEVLGKLYLGLVVPIPQSLDSLKINLGYFQVGAAPLVINEVLAAPAQGQGEWVEFQFTENEVQSLDQYSIRDEGGTWVSLPLISGSKGDLAVIAQDSLGLIAWMDNVRFEGGSSGCPNTNPPPLLMEALGSWPALNNSAPDGRSFADRLYLCDEDGCVIDHVTLGWEIPGLEMDVPDGHSVERIRLAGDLAGGAIWAPSLAQSGSTPGCPNSSSFSQGLNSDLELVPLIIDPDLGIPAISIGFEIESPGMGYDLQIFDLWGQLVRDLGGDEFGTGHRQLLWDGTDDNHNPLPTGAYVVLLRIRTHSGQILDRQKKLAVIKRSGL